MASPDRTLLTESSVTAQGPLSAALNAIRSRLTDVEGAIRSRLTDVEGAIAPLKLFSARFRTGTGSPEGVVTAPVGTTYTDTAATNGVLEWTKFTGNGNTGWKITKRSEGDGIKYVSGVVNPDTSVPVHEYFTTGPATIDGTQYEAEQAVVLFRVQGFWVHRTVELPKPPAVTWLTSLDDSNATAKPTFTLTSPVTVPRDGLLVASLHSQGGASTITVGGKSLTRIVDPPVWSNPGPSIWSTPVKAGDSLGGTVAFPNAKTFMGLDLLLLERVDPAPYATVQSSGSAGVPTVPDAPAGSIVLCPHTNRGVKPVLGVNWTSPPLMVGAPSRTILGNYPTGDPRFGTDILAETRWGRHPGDPFVTTPTQQSRTIAVAVFRASV